PTHPAFACASSEQPQQKERPRPTRSFTITMATRALPIAFAALLFALSPVAASPQGPPGSFGSGSNPYGSGSGSKPGSGSNPNGSDFGFDFKSGLQNVKRIVLIHAVLAALAWVIFVPIRALLLLLN